jgi:hypothetical protein
MSDLLRTGSTWLESIRQANATTAVQYRRDSARPVTVTIPDATLGTTMEEAQSQDGITVAVRIRDYIFAAATLQNAGIFPPKSGDQITEVNSGVWEVMAIPHEKEWRWHDLNETAIRVHTKKVTA